MEIRDEMEIRGDLQLELPNFPWRDYLYLWQQAPILSGSTASLGSSSKPSRGIEETEPKATPEGAGTVALATPEATPLAHDATPEAAGGVPGTPDAASDVASDAASDIASDAVSDIVSDAVSDIASDAATLQSSLSSPVGLELVYLSNQEVRAEVTLLAPLCRRTPHGLILHGGASLMLGEVLSTLGSYAYCYAQDNQERKDNAAAFHPGHKLGEREELSPHQTRVPQLIAAEANHLRPGRFKECLQVTAKLMSASSNLICWQVVLQNSAKKSVAKLRFTYLVAAPQP